MPAAALMPRDEFLERARRHFGDDYTYPDLPDLVPATFRAICERGHDLASRPRAGHLRGQACRVCVVEDRSERARLDAAARFIPDMQVKWGDKCDYSLTEYIDAKTPVTVICLVDEHGPFQVKPKDHRDKPASGCPHCGTAGKAAATKITETEFWLRTTTTHSATEGLSFERSVYRGMRELLDFDCANHGPRQRPALEVAAGKGCQQCAFDARGALKTRRALAAQTAAASPALTLAPDDYHRGTHHD